MLSKGSVRQSVGRGDRETQEFPDSFACPQVGDAFETSFANIGRVFFVSGVGVQEGQAPLAEQRATGQPGAPWPLAVSQPPQLRRISVQEFDGAYTPNGAGKSTAESTLEPPLVYISIRAPPAPLPHPAAV